MAVRPCDDWTRVSARGARLGIAGLSQGVVVFEAGNLGGTLDTGLTSLKLQVPLFAAIYEGMPPTAGGNRLQIAGGIASSSRRRAGAVVDSPDPLGPAMT